MNEENKNIVIRFLKETNDQNFAAYEELLHEDIVAHFPGGQDVAGIENMREAEGAFAASFPDMVRIIHELLCEGDKVVARFILEGTHKGIYQGIAPTGKNVKFTGTVIYRIDQGKIAEAWVEADFQGLITQLN